MLKALRRPGIAACLILSLGAAACTTDPYTGEKRASRTAVGAGVGAALGALGGALVGGSSGRKSTVVGAGIGALAGGAAGAYMEAEAAELRKQLKGTGVSVVEKDDTIILNMPGNVTFDTDSADLKPEFYKVLDSVALVLKEYEKTYVDILGHTDSRGAEEYNQELSRRRAESVAAYLRNRGVTGERMVVRGLGETMPIATNETTEGRQLNRRVEIALTPVT